MLAHQGDKLAWGLTGGGNNPALGVEEENGLNVKTRKGEYVHWKLVEILDW